MGTAESTTESPRDLTKRTWSYVLLRSVREFRNHRGLDIGAALSFYAVVAMFPVLIALLSIIGLTGDSQEAVTAILEVVTNVAGSGTSNTVEPFLDELANSESAGLALVLGIATALWSASSYTAAFAHAMNRMYGVDEGRRFVKFRGAMMGVTAVLLIMGVTVGVAVALSGPLARAVGEALGLESTTLTIWSIAKWPVVVLLVVLMVALLYWASPNVKKPKFRWLSIGAALGLVVWILASAGFAFFVANYSNFNQTYGALAGVVVFLLWLWLTNMALLFGAELDAEIERGRELQSGIRAEEQVQLPPRDTSKIADRAEQEREDIDEGREIRLEHSRRGRA